MGSMTKQFTHVHSGFDGMIEEDAVHGLADPLSATESERKVGDTTADFTALKWNELE